MDDITLRLLVLLRKLRLDIHRATRELQSIQQTSDPSYEEYSADHDAESTDIERELFATIKAIKEANGSAEAKQYALDHRRYRLEWKGFMLGRIGAWVLVAYTALTAVITIYSIRTADITKETMIRAQRPWLGKERVAELSTEILPNSEFVAGQLGVNIKNFGPSPALNAGLGAQPFIRRHGDTSDFTKARQEACGMAKTLGSVAGSSVFPQQVYEFFAPVGAQIDGINKIAKTATVLVAGCIAYSDQFDPGGNTIHYTSFCVMGKIGNLDNTHTCDTQEITN
jgi:hypothetical protein